MPTDDISTLLAKKRVLITGGAGMLGSTVAHLAVDCGAHVTILDAMLPQYGGNPFNLRGIEDQIDFIKGDIRDADIVRKLVKDRDYIFNFAAQVSYVDSNTDPFLDLDINCRGHLILLEACRIERSRAKIVFSSSRFVYGQIESNPVDEKHPFNCLSIYGIHKLAGEKYHRFYHDAYGIDTVCLRIANPYGPRQQMKHSKYGIANWFVRLALDGKPLTIYGDGSQRRDYVYVEDVARAAIAVALTPRISGQIFNIGSGVGTPFLEMAKLIAHQIPGTTIRHVEWPADRYFVETGDYVADLSAITAATRWRPLTSLEQGIAATIAYYQLYRCYYW